MLYWDADQSELNENEGDDFIPIVQAARTPITWPNLDEVSFERSRAGDIADLDSVADMLTKMKHEGCSVAIPSACCRPVTPMCSRATLPPCSSPTTQSVNYQPVQQTKHLTLQTPSRSVLRSSNRSMDAYYVRPIPSVSNTQGLPSSNHAFTMSCCHPTSRHRISRSSYNPNTPSSNHRVNTSVSRSNTPASNHRVTTSICRSNTPSSNHRVNTSVGRSNTPSSNHRVTTSVNCPIGKSRSRVAITSPYCPIARTELRALKKKQIAITAEELRQFRQQALEEHNNKRKHHGVQPLVLKNSLCQIAQEWAEHLAEIETLEHHKHSPYGENLFHSTGTTITAEEMVADWYNEGENYNFSKPGFTNSTNHFTQIVWKDTKFLGVGMRKTDNHTWIVCNYEPSGNIIGKFGDQVLHVKNTPSLTDEALTEAQAKIYRDEFANACLEVHNKYRSKHGCPPLKLSLQLNKYANDWAQQLAKIGTLQHRPNDKYGQNLFMASNYDPSAEEVVKDWYSEITEYDFKRPDFSTDTGNFTQLIWKNTRELGVGIQKIGITAYIVCHYNPQGNLIGEFRENVPPLKKELGHGLRTPSETSIDDQLAGGFDVPSEPRCSVNYWGMSFDEQCLKSHNKYRSMHGSPPLVLNKELSTYAAEWAKHLARTGKFEHRTNNRYGENLFYASGYVVTGGDPVTSWYEEIKNYNFKRPGFHQTTGHFTQLIWKKTKQLGVGIALEGRVTFVVCNYEPHGNVIDHFAENVPQVGGAILKDEKSLLRTENILQNLTYHVCNVSVNNAQAQPKATEVREFEEACLKAHNQFRAMHGCPPLKLNRNLCTFSFEWAKELAKKKSFEHRPNNKYGENLYFGSGFKISAEDAVRTWYNEIHDYNFKKPAFHPDIGHFTQLIWKSSKELGAALYVANTTTYVVCNYDPPGNIMGQFEDNVPQPSGGDGGGGGGPSTSKRAPEKQGVTASSPNFVQRMTDLHNEYRAKHGCTPLKLDRNLTNYAMEWAKHLATTDSLVHRSPQQYGENIFKATGWDITAEEVMKTWYDEEKQYKYSDAKFSTMCGHFTQIVWKDTQLLGVGATVRDKSTYVVCNYEPPGNFRNEYKQNVPPPKSAK